jgi:hypothetical protein
MLFGASAYGQSVMSLGGLSPFDRLGTVFDKLHNPDLVKARRMDNPGDDHAALLYQRQGTVVVALAPSGDRIMGIISESPAMEMGDGTKIGTSRTQVVSKYGQPDETSKGESGVTEYWYWAKGLNVDISDNKDAVMRIYVFPPVKAPANTERANVPWQQIAFRHRYAKSERGSLVTGVLRNKTSSPRYGVRVGVTLLDKRSKPVATRFLDMGSLLPGTSRQFSISVPPKGTWSSYRMSVQARSIYNMTGFMATSFRQQDRSRTVRQSLLSLLLSR